MIGLVIVWSGAAITASSILAATVGAPLRFTVPVFHYSIAVFAAGLIVGLVEVFL